MVELLFELENIFKIEFPHDEDTARALTSLAELAVGSSAGSLTTSRLSGPSGRELERARSRLGLSSDAGSVPSGGIWASLRTSFRERQASLDRRCPTSSVGSARSTASNSTASPAYIDTP